MLLLLKLRVEIDITAELVCNLSDAPCSVFAIDKYQHVDRHVAVSPIEIDAEAFVILPLNLLIERFYVAVLAACYCCKITQKEVSAAIDFIKIGNLYDVRTI